MKNQSGAKINDNAKRKNSFNNGVDNSTCLSRRHPSFYHFNHCKKRNQIFISVKVMFDSRALAIAFLPEYPMKLSIGLLVKRKLIEICLINPRFNSVRDELIFNIDDKEDAPESPILFSENL